MCICLQALRTQIPIIIYVMYVLVISQYKWVILVITQVWGKAEDKG